MGYESEQAPIYYIKVRAPKDTDWSKLQMRIGTSTKWDLLMPVEIIPQHNPWRMYEIDPGHAVYSFSGMLGANVQLNPDTEQKFCDQIFEYIKKNNMLESGDTVRVKHNVRSGEIIIELEKGFGDETPS